MNTSLFYKHSYFVISVFFMYITYMTKLLNESFSAPQDFMLFEIPFFPFYITGSFICLILLLMSLFQKKTVKTVKKPITNRVSFFVRRFFSGFFFAFGICYFVNAIILTDFFINTFVKTYNLPFSWLQINLFSLLVLSVIVLSTYYMPPKIKLFPFLGIILLIVGLVSLFFTMESIEQPYPVLFLYVSGLFGNAQIISRVLFDFLLFAVFWIFTIKLNQSDLDYFGSAIGVWFNTICVTCLVFLLLLLVEDKLILFFSVYLNQKIPIKEVISTVLYGVFLWLCIRTFCFFEVSKKYFNFSVTLDSWFFSFLTIMLVTQLRDIPNIFFLFKIFLIVLGIYCFWNSAPFRVLELRMVIWKQCTVVFLLSILFAVIVIWNFYQCTLGGIVITNLYLKVLYFLLIQEHVVVVIFITALFLSIYLLKKRQFEKSCTLLLNGIFAGIASFLAINLLQEYGFALLLKPLYSIPESFSWWITFLKSKLFYINQAVAILCLAIFYCTFKLGSKRGKRLVLWTVLSNCLLYIALSKMLYQCFDTLFGYSNGLMSSLTADSIQLLEKISYLNLIKETVTHIIPLFILFLSVLIYFNKNIEEKILPSVLQCRDLQRLEKRKLEEALAILKEKKDLVKVESIQVLISQITEYNAYTIGNKAIAITEPLFKKLTSQQLAGCLLHEFGHIEHNDGRLRILLYVLNLPTTLIKKILYLFIGNRSKVITLVCFSSLLAIMFSHAIDMMYFGVRDVICWFLLQSAIFLMQNQDTQESEWKADDFAITHGLGKELKEALLQMTTIEKLEADRDSLMDNYPDLAERIQRLETIQNPVGV